MEQCQHANVETKRYVGTDETYRLCADCGRNLSESPRLRRMKENAIRAAEMYGEDALELYAEQQRRGRLTYDEAVAEFRRDVLPFVRLRYERDAVDETARREAWNNWTDGLCKCGRISSTDYETWECPD